MDLPCPLHRVITTVGILVPSHWQQVQVDIRSQLQHRPRQTATNLSRTRTIRRSARYPIWGVETLIIRIYQLKWRAWASHQVTTGRRRTMLMGQAGTMARHRQHHNIARQGRGFREQEGVDLDDLYRCDQSDVCWVILPTLPMQRRATNDPPIKAASFPPPLPTLRRRPRLIRKPGMKT